MAAPLLIGIDVGGTKSTLEATVEGRSHLESGPGANLNRTNREHAASVLSALTQTAFEQFSHDGPAYACAGVAGAGRSDEARALAERWRSLLPKRLTLRVTVVHDGVIALEGAFAGESGAVLIAGTGSLALGKTKEGALVRAGGWGFVLGDEGSGYAIGRAGLRATAAVFDGAPASHLTSLISERFAIRNRDDLVRIVYEERLPLERVAPTVVDAAAAGDAAALDLLEREARSLAHQLDSLGTEADPIARRVAPIGGLADASVYGRILRTVIEELDGGWEVSEPRERPPQGALRLAKRMADASGDA